jgi:hypothetical protein
MIDERELFDTKWFEYRPIDPDTATLVFIKAWAKRMQKYNALLGKYPVVFRDYRSFNRARLSKMKRWNTMARLRQFCDKHGMPYGKFWEWACEAHLELKLHKMHEVYFTNEKLLFEVKAAWEQHKRNFIVTSDSWLLHPDFYRGYEWQNDYYEYVIGEIKRRNHKSKWLEVVERYVKDEKIPVDFYRNVQYMVTKQAA